MKCSFCGAELDGRYCSQCGMLAQEPAQPDPAPGEPLQPGQQQTGANEPAAQQPPRPAAAQPQQRRRRSIWKRWWFYPLAIITTLIVFRMTASVLLGVIKSFTTTFDTHSKQQTETDTVINWEKLQLGERIPQSTLTRGKILKNSAQKLSLILSDATYTKYTNYVELCKQGGYDLNASEASSSYSAENESGDALMLQFDYSEGLRIELSVQSAEEQTQDNGGEEE